IEAALQELASRFDFEYVPIRSVSHEDAMKLYRSADLVIDQLLAGWYGGIAVETMAMGKPVACYIPDEDLYVLPPEMRAGCAGRFAGPADQRSHACGRSRGHSRTPA